MSIDRSYPRRSSAADKRRRISSPNSQHSAPLTISLKTLARRLDADRSSVRRWLRDAGIRPVAIGRGRNGAIRYRWKDVEEWLASLEYVE